MKKSSSEQQSRIRKQFDSFCKTLLKNEMIDYERERNYRLKYEISFSELTQKELRQLEIMDDYIVESEMFHVFDYDIEVKDELIGEALKSLPEKKRNVILLSFSGYDRYRNCKIYESCKKYHSSSSYKFPYSFKKDYGGDQDWKKEIIQSYYRIILLCRQRPEMWKQLTGF